MAQDTNALIYNAGRIGANSDDTIANIIDGAQLGFGNHLPVLDAATPLVFRPVVPIVTHSPTMFESTPYFDAVLKALVERHASEITGIDFEYTLEAATSPAGHDGQEMNVPTNAKRSSVTPSFTWPEVTGNLVWNFIRTWMHGIKNPDTQASMAGALGGSTSIPPHLMSYFSMDCLFIQYDTTLMSANIIDAILITAMWPQTTGMLGLKKTIGDSTIQMRSIPFHGIVQHNANTKRVGQNIADILQLHKVDYDFSTPVAQAINSRLSNRGVQSEVTAAISAFTEIA